LLYFFALPFLASDGKRFEPSVDIAHTVLNVFALSFPISDAKRVEPSVGFANPHEKWLKPHFPPGWPDSSSPARPSAQGVYTVMVRKTRYASEKLEQKKHMRSLVRNPINE
jgi:hypothetical protein